MLDTLYSFAKFQYECGNYSGAADYLYLHRGLVPMTDKVMDFFKEFLYNQACESSADPRISADLAAPRAVSGISPNLMRNFGEKIFGGGGELGLKF